MNPRSSGNFSALTDKGEGGISSQSVILTYELSVKQILQFNQNVTNGNKLRLGFNTNTQDRAEQSSRWTDSLITICLSSGHKSNDINKSL